MGDYYDKSGLPISFREWARLSEQSEYRFIKQDILPDGKFVSTVWLGLNHRFDDGPPLIFETMVFGSREDFDELDLLRYATLPEALEGHKNMVEKWSKLTKSENKDAGS